MEFLNPLAFILLLGVLVVFIKNKNLPFKKDVIEKITKKVNFGKKPRFFLYLLAYILFVIALSEPIITNGYTTIKLPKKTIAIILDTSKAMKCSDIYPNRFTAAKEKLKKLLQKLKLQNVSVIIANKRPLLLNPPSNDYSSIIYLLEHINTHNLFISDVSTVNAAINSAKKNFKNPIIISFTYQKPKTGIFYNISLKPCVIDGNYYSYDKNGIHFSYSDKDINEILKIINQKNKTKTVKIKNNTELFYYFLIAGILLVFIATIRIFK